MTACHGIILSGARRNADESRANNGKHSFLPILCSALSSPTPNTKQAPHVPTTCRCACRPARPDNSSFDNVWWHCAGNTTGCQCSCMSRQKQLLVDCLFSRTLLWAAWAPSHRGHFLVSQHRQYADCADSSTGGTHSSCLSCIFMCVSSEKNHGSVELW